jgi:hypothetical protein
MCLKYIYKIIIPLFFIAASAGCKKWLDVSPKTQIREGELLTSEQGFEDALTGVYLKLGSRSLYGQNLTMGFLDVLGQYYSVSTSSNSTFKQAASFDYADAGVKGAIAGIWTDAYASIANLDNLLAQIDNKRGLFAESNFESVKGQALALRAFIHFDLLRLFGSAPVVNSEKKSIPYLTSFGVSVYPLLTVNQVMDSCLKDLSAAGELLSNNKTVSIRSNPNPSSNNMNYWAVKGLEARIYLYRGDKLKAKTAAMEVINNQTLFPFVKAAEAAATINRDRLYATEHLFALNVYNLKTYTEEYTKTNVVNGMPLLYTTTTNTKNLYETSSGGSSDIRFNYDFYQYGSGYSSSKYWQDDIAQSSYYQYLINTVPLIRLSEMYYIAAECSDDPAEGVGYLNTVRANRGLSNLDPAISADNLQTEILKEYKKEFYAEGQLFYYFKRLNKAKIDGSTVNATDVYVLPLPEDEIEFGKRF